MSSAWTPFGRVVDRLEEMGCHPSSQGRYVKAFCPAHDDRKQKSLSVRDMNGDAAPKCFVGCSFQQIVAALQLDTQEFFVQKAPLNGGKNARIVATYDYRGKDGELLFQVVRFEPKDFRVRRPGRQGKGWIWNMKGTQPVPYRLSEVLKAIESGELVFIAEGEKDCDQLAVLGLTATTNASGALKWTRSFSPFFQGARVVVVCDNDDKGREHASDVASKLMDAVAEVRILDLAQHGELPEKGDVSTWIELCRAQKRTQQEIRDELHRLVEWTPQWKSTPPADAAPTSSTIAAARGRKEEAELEDPIPLERALAPAPPFPVDRLPPVLSGAIRAIQEMTEAPMSICAQSVLATASLATQALVDIELPIGIGTVRPVSCYFVTLGVSYNGPKEGLAEALRKSLKTSASSAAEKEDSTIAGCASSVPGRQTPKKGETSPSPAEIKTGKPKGTVTRSNPSFFMVQESVFDAHDLGLRTLAELEGRPFHPTDRKTAQNRRDVAAAIRQVGAETARLAARNLVLSADHRSDETLYMDISLALGEPESFTALFEGPDAELENTLRESLKKQVDEVDEGRGTQGPTPLRDPWPGLAGVHHTTTSRPSGHGASGLRP